jgi:hypothetical protein
MSDQGYDDEFTGRRSGTTGSVPRADVDTRAEVARALGKEVYPADREALVLRAVDNRASEDVVTLLGSLPPGETFENVQDVAQALGLAVEGPRH